MPPIDLGLMRLAGPYPRVLFEKAATRTQMQQVISLHLARMSSRVCNGSLPSALCCKLPMPLSSQIAQECIPSCVCLPDLCIAGGPSLPLQLVFVTVAFSMYQKWSRSFHCLGGRSAAWIGSCERCCASSTDARSMVLNPYRQLSSWASRWSHSRKPWRSASGSLMQQSPPHLQTSAPSCASLHPASFELRTTSGLSLMCLRQLDVERFLDVFGGEFQTLLYASCAAEDSDILAASAVAFSCSRVMESCCGWQSCGEPSPGDSVSVLSPRDIRHLPTCLRMSIAAGALVFTREQPYKAWITCRS